MTMFPNRIKSIFKLPSVSQSSKKCLLKYLSTTERLIPVKLASTTYGETLDPQEPEPPLVVMHGLFGSKQNWSSLCKVYNQKMKNRKIIALDLRNHGESEHSNIHTYPHLAFDVKTFFSENNVNKAVVLGHSMGGRCAMLFALKYPELVDKLIIVDISPVTQSPHMGHMPTILNAMESVQFPINVNMSNARIIIDQQLAQHIPAKDLRAFLMTNLTQIGNQRYKWRVNISVLLEHFHEIAKFPAISDMQYLGETLFLGGGNSDFIPKSDYPKIRQLFPQAELKYIDGAGHWVHSEKPTEFLKVTMEFLNKPNPQNTF